MATKAGDLVYTILAENAMEPALNQTVVCVSTALAVHAPNAPLYFKIHEQSNPARRNNEKPTYPLAVNLIPAGLDALISIGNALYGRDSR